MDKYWSESLSNYTSFDSAMDLFRSIYTSINNCTETKCECFLDKIEPIRSIYTSFNYSYFFLNETNFNHMKSIAARINQNYTRRTVDQVNEDPEFDTKLDRSTPSLNEFCLKYDWPNTMSLYFYEEVRNCLKKEGQSDICYNETNEIQRLEYYISQLNCGNDVKAFIILAKLESMPERIKGDLYEFIETLISNNPFNPYISNFSVIKKFSTFNIIFDLLIFLIIYNKNF